jgi:hypothetical protein
MKPIPLFGTGIKSFASSVTAQRRLNCLVEIRKDGDKSNVIVRGTPGAFVAFSLNDAPLRGARVVGDFLYVVAGSTVYQVTLAGTPTALGTIINSGQFVDMSDNSIELAMVDGLNGWYVTLPAGVPTQILDANFPAGATSIDCLNSRFIVERPGTREYRLSQLLSASLWTPQIFGTKENSSDNLVRVRVFNGALILFGSQNMEFWQDIGSAPNPLARVNGASQTWGLAAKFSVAYINNSMIFLAQNPQGGVQVMMLNGYTPERVSESDLENIFANFATYQDAVALTYMYDGHPMYQITFPVSNRSFLFDASTRFWYEVQTGVGLQARHFAQLGFVFNAKNYVTDVASGNIYQLSSTVYTDNGTPIKRQIASRHIRMDGNEFGISEVYLEMDPGVGLATGQGSDPQIMMQVSKDNGKTFGPERWKKMGKAGQYKKRIHWDQLGSSEDFVLQYTMTDPVKFVVNLAEAVVSPGTQVGT